MNVAVVTAGALTGTHHGFLGRRGGVSSGLVAGLNVGLGSDDNPADVAENRRRAMAAVAPGRRLASVYQIHSSLAVVADSWPDDARPHADALVTDRRDLVLGIVTADCAPVLFADVSAGVVGAAHAGWKGALGGVTDATIAAMEALGAARGRIVAAVGPCIAQPSYEVDDAFVARFLAEDRATAAFFMAGRSGHAHFDLPGYVVHRLRNAGLARVEDVARDTLSDVDAFYSFRRATLRGEPDYGRQISLIALA